MGSQLVFMGFIGTGFSTYFQQEASYVDPIYPVYNVLCYCFFYLTNVCVEKRVIICKKSLTSFV